MAPIMAKPIMDFTCSLSSAPNIQSLHSTRYAGCVLSCDRSAIGSPNYVFFRFLVQSLLINTLCLMFFFLFLVWMESLNQLWDGKHRIWKWWNRGGTLCTHLSTDPKKAEVGDTVCNYCWRKWRNEEDFSFNVGRDFDTEISEDDDEKILGTHDEALSSRGDSPEALGNSTGTARSSFSHRLSFTKLVFVIVACLMGSIL